jgi:hypothetical protein
MVKQAKEPGFSGKEPAKSTVFTRRCPIRGSSPERFPASDLSDKSDSSDRSDRSDWSDMSDLSEKLRLY